MLVKYPIMGLSSAHGSFAICGGGGSLKSGIKNTVDIYHLSDADPTGFEKQLSVETGLELASGVAFSQDGRLLAVSVNAACWLYELDMNAKKMKLLIKFRTDFADEESSQTAACFVGNGTLITGGEDGVVRVWRLTPDASAKDKSAGTSKALVVATIESEEAAREKKKKAELGDKETIEKPKLGDMAIHGKYMVTLTREYRGHTKRIREIHVEPSHRNLIASSSEDQSCHLWRLNELSVIYKISKDDALDVAYQMLKLKPLVGPKKHQFRCVRFANDGRALYTVLIPARGDTLLLKWRPLTLTQTKEDEWQWVIESATVAGDRPVASLCVSYDDHFVSTAAVSGDVRVYQASDLRSYKKVSTEEHTFAITGMGFMPPADKHAKSMHLITGGADKRLLRHDVPLEGGAMTSGLSNAIAAVGCGIGGLVKLLLSLVTGATVLFILLLFIHAKNAVLTNGPLAGLQDLAELRFDSPDAIATLAASASALLITWIAASRATVARAVFWNGLFCLVAMLLSFFVAISPDLELQWKTGDEPFDELLDYKISILLGAGCIVLFFTHSVLTLLR